jgi:hypothetical protein
VPDSCHLGVSHSSSCWTYGSCGVTLLPAVLSCAFAAATDAAESVQSLCGPARMGPLSASTMAGVLSRHLFLALLCAQYSAVSCQKLGVIMYVDVVCDLFNKQLLLCCFELGGPAGRHSRASCRTASPGLALAAACTQDRPVPVALAAARYGSGCFMILPLRYL